MDKLEICLYILCALYSIIGCYAYKEQRIELEFSREIGFDIRKLVLPMWCAITAHLSWLLIIVSLYVMYRYSVINGVIILFINFILPGLIPFSMSDRTKTYKLLASYLDKNEYDTYQNANPDVLQLMIALQTNNTYEKIKKYRKSISEN